MEPTVRREIDPGQTLDGRFQVLDRLGKGGVGEVFRVLDLATRRVRALKVLQHQFVTDLGTLEQFKREAAARGIANNHPAIVDVFTIEKFSDGRPFILMELLSGTDLERHAAALPGQRLALDEAIRAVMVVADAVAAAHEQGLLHRDLKPSNIFRIAADDFRVLDFGMATLMGALSAEIGGTVSFSAPEQWVAYGRLGKPTDVFGLGATLYALVSGTPPLCRLVPAAKNPGELVAALLSRPTFPPLVEAPTAVWSVVERALRIDPSERFQDARAFASALGAAAPSVAGVRAVALGPDPIPQAPRGAAVSVRPMAETTRRVSLSVSARLEAAREKGAQSVIAVGDELTEAFAADLAAVLRTLRGLGAFEELVALFEQLGGKLSRHPELRELYGFSLNRLGRQAAAERELSALFEESPSGERAGLLARVFKDQYADAANDHDYVRARGFLRRAIDTYSRGFELSPDDPYCGVNALTLMEVLDDEQPSRSTLLADVTRCTQTRIASGEATFWDHATLLELAVLGSNEAAAQLALDQCVARTAGLDRWAPLSTARTLAMIGRARKARQIDVGWLRPLVERLVELSGELTGH